MCALAGCLYVMSGPTVVQTFHQQIASLEQEGQHWSSYLSAVPLQGDMGETRVKQSARADKTSAGSYN